VVGSLATYHEIMQLYKITTVPLDNEKFGSLSNRQSMHDSQDQEDQSDAEGQPYADIYSSQSRNNRPFVKRSARLPKDTWHSLSPSDQKN
jgi:hypothetical protein